MNVRIKLLCALAKAPRYMTPGAAGADLYATERYLLAPGQRAAIQTGIAIEMPPGYHAEVRPRSGLFLAHGVLVCHGTIDSDYRGEVRVLLFNAGREDFKVQFLDRIAQLVIWPVERAEFTVTNDDLGETERGERGLGSTGL